MGELMIQLANLHLCRNKKVKKRVPFRDCSNIRRINCDIIAKENITHSNIKSSHCQNRNPMDVYTFGTSQSQIKELKVVLQRIDLQQTYTKSDWKDSGKSNSDYESVKQKSVDMNMSLSHVLKSDMILKVHLCKIDCYSGFQTNREFVTRHQSTPLSLKEKSYSLGSLQNNLPHYFVNSTLRNNKMSLRPSPNTSSLQIDIEKQKYCPVNDLNNKNKFEEDDSLFGFDTTSDVQVKNKCCEVVPFQISSNTMISKVDSHQIDCNSASQTGRGIANLGEIDIPVISEEQIQKKQKVGNKHRNNRLSIHTKNMSKFSDKDGLSKSCNRQKVTKSVKVPKSMCKDKCENYDDVLSTTPISNRLRPICHKNYLEASDNSSINISMSTNKQAENITTKKIPIYKQNIMVENKVKADPYELDLSDSEKNNKKRHKKTALNMSAKYDKTMYEVLKKLEKQKKYIKKQGNKLSVKKKNYDENIRNVVHKMIENVNAKKQVNIKTQDKGKETQTITKQVDDNQDENKLCASSPLCHMNKNPSKALNEENCRGEFELDDITELPIYQPHSPTTSIDSDVGLDNWFGFNEDGNQMHLTNDRIKIISNVRINHVSKHNASQGKTAEITPDGSPWRLKTARDHNYVLAYKKNAMPCLEQDAVVEYNLAKNIEESFSKNKSTSLVAKTSNVQKSITDYINYPEKTNLNNKENVFPTLAKSKSFIPSLYDYEDFVTTQQHSTPLSLKDKNRSVLGALQNNSSQNCVNSTPLRVNKMTVMPSPNISLIQKDTEIQNISHVKELENNPRFEDEAFFGFDNSTSDIQENSKCCSQAVPYRISLNTIRNYQRKNKRRTLPETNLNEANNELPSVLNNDNVTKSTDQDVHIFDDVEPELLENVDMLIKCSRKGRRRQRLGSNASECSDEEKVNKRKKNAMTKAEEEAFEKWAAQFNAMCNEIDKHNLEIE